MARFNRYKMTGLLATLIGIALLILSAVDTYAYPHGERYQTDIVVEAHDGHKDGLLWKEDLSDLDVPGWLKWKREHDPTKLRIF